MTLTRTIRRREKRQRAKAAAAERSARLAAMSPAERAFIESQRKMLAELALPLLRDNLAMANYFSRSMQWTDAELAARRDGDRLAFQARLAGIRIN